jgi:hypothetical protein
VSCCDCERSHAGEELRFYGMMLPRLHLPGICSVTLLVLTTIPSTYIVWTSYLCNPRMSFIHEDVESSNLTLLFGAACMHRPNAPPHTFHRNVPPSNVRRTPSCSVSCYNGRNWGILPLQLPWTLHQPSSTQRKCPSRR